MGGWSGEGQRPMTTTHTAEGAGGQAGAAQRLRRAGRRSGAFVAFTLQAEITMLSQTSWMVGEHSAVELREQST